MTTTHVSPSRTVRAQSQAWTRYHPGDFVTTAGGYPVLFEVLTVDSDGLLRVRGLNWAAGYSATISAEDVRPITGILSQP